MTRLLICALFLLAGCVPPVHSPDSTAPQVVAERLKVTARATLGDAGGRQVASAEFGGTAGDPSVRLVLSVTGMAPGTYAAHVHTVGRCDAPDFTTAGPHWNPTGAQHGRDNPAGAHLGDLPNLSVGINGRGELTYRIAGSQLRGGAGAMLDADGAAIVVHAGADDGRTDPSGNSGARIACGVIR